MENELNDPSSQPSPANIDDELLAFAEILLTGTGLTLPQILPALASAEELPEGEASEAVRAGWLTPFVEVEIEVVA